MNKPNSKSITGGEESNLSSSPTAGGGNLTLRFIHQPFQTPRISSIPNSDNADKDKFTLSDERLLQDTRPHHTLGQMAEQFQEKARAIRLKNSASDYSEDEVHFPVDEESEDDHGSAAQNESTGRWTKQEHELFLEALKKYGKVVTL